MSFFNDVFGIASLDEWVVEKAYSDWDETHEDELPCDVLQNMGIRPEDLSTNAFLHFFMMSSLSALSERFAKKADEIDLHIALNPFDEISVFINSIDSHYDLEKKAVYLGLKKPGDISDIGADDLVSRAIIWQVAERVKADYSLVVGGSVSIDVADSSSVVAAVHEISKVFDPDLALEDLMQSFDPDLDWYEYPQSVMECVGDRISLLNGELISGCWCEETLPSILGGSHAQ
ncbi:hypothetical protein [Thiomicrorhabdus indica]|uniref:hypothetical protein n=1 Tax=Thiomicrorhabdus indica TaxID=2267253 RepID=UPI00102DB22D|nr:hypothetical protein [Thiomicrorhabdus indica]